MSLIGGGTEKLRIGLCSNGEERESREVEGTGGGRASLPLEPAVRASQGVAGGGNFSRSTDKHVQATGGLKRRRGKQSPCGKERTREKEKEKVEDQGGLRVGVEMKLTGRAERPKGTCSS